MAFNYLGQIRCNVMAQSFFLRVFSDALSWEFHTQNSPSDGFLWIENSLLWSWSSLFLPNLRRHICFWSKLLCVFRAKLLWEGWNFGELANFASLSVLAPGTVTFIWTQGGWREAAGQQPLASPPRLEVCFDVQSPVPASSSLLRATPKRPHSRKRRLSEAGMDAAVPRWPVLLHISLCGWIFLTWSTDGTASFPSPAFFWLSGACFSKQNCSLSIKVFKELWIKCLSSLQSDKQTSQRKGHILRLGGGQLAQQLDLRYPNCGTPRPSLWWVEFRGNYVCLCVVLYAYAQSEYLHIFGRLISSEFFLHFPPGCAYQGVLFFKA